jgi:hypothetical protein
MVIVDLYHEGVSCCLGGTLADPRWTSPNFTHLDDDLGRPRDHPPSSLHHPKGARDFYSGVLVKEDILHNVWQVDGVTRPWEAQRSTN